MTHTFGSRLLGTLATITLAGVAFASPALATGDHASNGDDHDRGGHSTSWGGASTSDTSGGHADDGDNRHPSGKDRSVEHGGSGTQGKSGSDPDGMANGGKDKPGGTGGVDKADQDGNNGCGNDDDFEDDNNGNCGGHHHKHHGKPACSTSSMPTAAEHGTSGKHDENHGDKSGFCTQAKPATVETTPTSTTSTTQPPKTVSCSTGAKHDGRHEGEHGTSWRHGDKSGSCTQAKPAEVEKIRDLCLMKVEGDKATFTGTGCKDRSHAACAILGGTTQTAKPEGFIWSITLPASSHDEHADLVKLILDTKAELLQRIEALEALKAAAPAPATTTTMAPTTTTTVPPTTTTTAATAVSGAGGSGTTGGAAAAEGPDKPEVLGVSAQAAPASGVGSSTGALAFTGANALRLLVVALALLAIGGWLLMAGRKRSIVD